MIDYEKKSYVIQSGLVDECKKIKSAFFYNAFPNSSWTPSLDIDTARYEQSFFLENNSDDWHEANNIVHAEYNRRVRLRSRISSLLTHGQCLFLTLTFTDDVLSNTSASTRRKYVTRFLSSVAPDSYIGNIDFGAKNGREHYHAIVQCAKIDHSLWKYGAINFKRVKDGSNPKALARYIAKMTNHAIKETCLGHRTIYPKSFSEPVSDPYYDFHPVKDWDCNPFDD